MVSVIFFLNFSFDPTNKIWPNNVLEEDIN